MLLNSSEVLENIDEVNLTRELEIAKFRNYAREKFSGLIRYDISFNEYILSSSKFHSIKLPREISECFIRADIAPYFIMTDTPVIKAIEELLILKKNNNNVISNFREIKNYYYNWLVQKNPKEKKYYANSVINSVERNFAYQSFFNLTLYGIVLSYDKNSYNISRAIELFDRAIELVQNLNIPQNVKDEILYIITLYKGFAHLNEYEYLKSLETFKKALIYNPNGATAFFYCALSARYVDDFDMSYDYLRELIEFDKVRFEYAIRYNHLSLFAFFYETAVFYNVFTENGFSQLLPDIDFLIRSLYSGEADSMEFTYSKLINLDNLRIKNFYNDAVFNEIKFLKDALDQYKQKRNGLIRIVEQIFRDKLVTLIEFIRNHIESHYFDLIKEEINVFDKQIEQNKRQLTRINHEMEDAKKKIVTNVEEAARYLEESITDRAKFLEQKIEYLDKSPKYNPTQILYSSLVFTLMISFVILFVVGVITSFVGYGDEAASTYVALKTGLKWGGITIVIGVFMSIFSALSSFWEKSSEKKTLVSELKKVKESEAEEREFIHEDSDSKVRIFDQKFKDRIKAQEKIINDFITEREQNYKHKYDLAKKEIDEYTNPLNNLLKSLNNTG